MQPRDLSEHVEYEAGRGIEEVARELGRRPRRPRQTRLEREPVRAEPGGRRGHPERGPGTPTLPEGLPYRPHCALAERWNVTPTSRCGWRTAATARSITSRAPCSTPDDTVLVPSPGFAYYGMCARYHHGEVTEYHLSPDDDFSLAAETVLSDYDGERIVYLTSPHNPSGGRFALDAVTKSPTKPTRTRSSSSTRPTASTRTRRARIPSRRPRRRRRPAHLLEGVRPRGRPTRLRPRPRGVGGRLRAREHPVRRERTRLPGRIRGPRRRRTRREIRRDGGVGPRVHLRKSRRARRGKPTATSSSPMSATCDRGRRGNTRTRRHRPRLHEFRTPELRAYHLRNRGGNPPRRPRTQRGALLVRVAVTGTPGTGKTTATELVESDSTVVHLNDAIREEELHDGEDEERGSLYANLDAIREWLDVARRRPARRFASRPPLRGGQGRRAPLSSRRAVGTTARTRRDGREGRGERRERSA